MKEKIRKLSRGYVDTEFPSVKIDPIEINSTVMSGETRKAEIHITSENRLHIRGFIYSSNPKVILSCDNILGVFVHVSYMVDAERLEAGEVLDGEFSIVTNAGEFIIPYSFVVVKGNSEGVEIESVKGFYNLYLANPKKAKEMFLSPDFVYLPFMLDARRRSYYDGFVESSDVDNSIIEFFKANDIHVDNPNINIANVNVSQANISDEALLLRDETSFDHAKINYETNDILRRASLLEMQNAFKDMKKHGASIDVLKFHKAEIAYYKNYSKNKAFKVDRITAYRYLNKCYQRGCRSPYLYLEACKAFIEYPDLIKDFNELTIKAINFGSKHGFLSDEIARRVAIHVESSKNVSEMLLVSMKRMYKYYPSKELLSAIVSKLARFESVDEGSFKWYLKGIDEGLQISRLYDYFIESVPIDYNHKLPKEVYIYFSYNSPTTYSGKKKLYYNIVKFFDVSSPTYLDYEIQIRNFVVTELLASNIDSELAVLYEKFLHIDMVDERTAKIIPDILLTNIVNVHSSHFERLVVLYDELVGEQIVSLVDGKAQLPLYTDNYHFLVEDNMGRRFYPTSVSVQKLITGKDNLIFTCARHIDNIPAFRIMEANSLIDTISLDRSGVERLRELASSSGIHPLYITKINNAICNNFDWQNNKDMSDILSSCLEDGFMDDTQKANLSNTLISIGKDAEAEGLIKKIGYNKIDLEGLLDLCTNYIKSGDGLSDIEITKQSFYLFKRNLYNDETLGFLCKNYNGLCLDMANILLVSASKTIPTYDMAERLLSQMLFTNNYKDIDEIFNIYVQSGKVNIVVITAYFTLKCSRYFLNGEEIGCEIFNSIKQVLITQLINGSAPIIVQLAITKYFSTLDELNKEDKNICSEVVDNLVNKGIVFPYLKKLAGYINLPEEIKDKTIITFKAKEGDSVALILITEDDTVEPLYIEMNYVGFGLFVKPVLLFEEEYQSYQIRITRNGEHYISEEGELKSDIAYDDSNRKFIRLNKLLVESEDPSSEAWQKKMADYAFDNALNKLLFTN